MTNRTKNQTIIVKIAKKRVFVILGDKMARVRLEDWYSLKATGLSDVEAAVSVISDKKNIISKNKPQEFTL